MAEIVLTGCAPSPLGSYLKALGILRVIAEQADSGACGFWQTGQFVLNSKLSTGEVRRFFLDTYRPTPIISPWNGRAGFLEGENADDSKRKGAKIIHQIIVSKGERFAAYQSVLTQVQQIPIISQLNIIRSEIKVLESKKKKGQSYSDEQLKKAKSEDKKLKKQLLTALRGKLSEDFLPWLDACLVLAGDSSITSPLLGSGGNEGSMDFSINHLILLSKLIDVDTDKANAPAVDVIDNALFGTPSPIALRGNPGFLNPPAVVGNNMGTGFSGGTEDNAWNTVLMLEGTLLFAAAATRRFDSNMPSALSFPFMVETVLAGHGGVAPSESARPEFWVPLWTSPVSLIELRALLAEGRATIGRRQVKNGLDMARAAATLGVDRGVTAFQRYGLFERRGQGYYVAVPLGLVPVTPNPQSEWIDELEQGNWLSRFRRFAQGNKVADRFITLRKRLEDALFDLARRPLARAKVQALLALLGEIQAALAVSAQARKAVRPVPRLSERWVRAADDGTSAFRIARALAGLSGSKDQPLPLRAQLFPVHPRRNNWIDVACSAKGMQTDPACRVRLHTGLSGPLIKTLNECLTRRLWLADRLNMPDKPLQSPAGIDLDDLNAFLRDQRMDRQIAALLPGLALCQIPLDTEHAAGTGTVPAAFALLKLCLTPDTTLQYLERLGKDEHLPVPTGLLAQLGVGNSGKAVRAAWRRLRFSGLAPLFMPNALPELIGIDPRRAAAALLIPLRLGTSGALVRSVLRNAEITDDAA